MCAKLLPFLCSSIPFYCSSSRSHLFRPLPLLLWCLAGGEREVSQSLLLCILWYIIYDLLYSDGCSAATPPLPAVAAIAGVIAVLIAISIMVAAGQTRIKIPSLPLFLPFAPPDQISPLSPFSLSCGLAPPLPPSSFHPPFSCFKVST